jgi:hypothetical protein
MSSSESARCERCGHDGPLRRPGLAPRLALAGVYVAFVVMLTGAALTGLGIVALGPLAVALAVLMQAPVAEAALAPPRCARCGCYASAPDARVTPAPTVSRAVTA